MNEILIELNKTKSLKEQYNYEAQRCGKCKKGNIIYNNQGIYSCTNTSCNDFENTYYCKCCNNDNVYLNSDDYFYCYNCKKNMV